MSAQDRRICDVLAVALGILVLVGLALLVAPGVDPEEAEHDRAVSACRRIPDNSPACVRWVTATMTEDDR